MAVTIFTAVYLLLLSFFDWRRKAVPVLWLWIGGIALLIYEICEVFSGDFLWQQYLWGRIPAMIPGITLLAVACITKKAGMADGIVLLLLGILLGYQKCILLFGVSLFFVSLFAGGILLLRRGNKDTGIPYLPFVAAAYLLGIWLWR